jgi:hypothetical protein
LTHANYTLVGTLNGDAISLNSPTGTYDSIHVGAFKTVTFANLSLSGSDTADYTLASPTAAAAIGAITPATVTANLGGTVSKVYDSKLAATLAAANYTLTGVLGTDAVTLNDPSTGAFDTKDVGTGKTVSVGGLALAGADAGDYVLADTRAAGPIGAITTASLIVTAIAATKTFDTTVGSNALPTVTGLQGGDTAVASETYDTAQIGTGKTMTPAAVVNDGNGGADYTLTLVDSKGGVIIGNPSSGVYIPTVGNVSDTGITNASGTLVTGPIPALSPLVSLLPATQLLAFDSTIAGVPAPAVPGLTDLPIIAYLPPMTPSAVSVGQAVTGTYADGSAASMTLLAVNPRSVTFTVPNSALQLFVSVPVAGDRGIVAQVTVYVANGEAEVSLDSAQGTASAPDEPQPATESLEETLTSPGDQALEFGLTLGEDLNIVAENLSTTAVLISGTDATLLKITLGRALIDAYTKLHAGKIHAVRVLAGAGLTTSPAAPAVHN